MAKLRNSDSDIGKLTQWFGRKCRNHHPLEELSIPVTRDGERAPMPNIYKPKSKGNIAVLADDDSVLLYSVGNRTFEITVREVGEDAHLGKARIAVLG